MPYAANGKISQDRFEGAIEITDKQYAQALDGMCNGLEVTIQDGFKVAPSVPVEPPPTPEPTQAEQAALALAERDRLLSRASLRMAPLQDAIDLGRATQEEVASLTLWKQYRVDLNRIEQQEAFPKHVKWPVAPDSVAL